MDRRALIRIQTFRQQLGQYVVDAVPLMADAQKKETAILVEGA